MLHTDAAARQRGWFKFTVLFRIRILTGANLPTISGYHSVVRVDIDAQFIEYVFVARVCCRPDVEPEDITNQIEAWSTTVHSKVH